MIRKLFKDIGQYFPAKIIPSIVTVISLPILTRLFPPSDYGSYVLAIGVVSILTIVGGWVGLSISRFYPAYEKKGKREEFSALILKLTFLTLFVTSLIFLSAIVFLKKQIPENLFNLLEIGIIVYIFSSLFTILLNFLKIRRQINWYSGFSIWIRLAGFIFGISLIVFFHFGLGGLLWGIVLSAGLALPFLWKMAVRKIRKINKGIPYESALELAKYSFPLVIGSLAAWILSLSDRYMLELFRESKEVGIYSISYAISQNSILFITSLFALAFNPLSIIIWENQGEKISKEFVASGTRYFLILCIPAVIGMSILREPILRFFSTPNYYEGAKIIPLVGLGIFFFGLTQRFGIGLALYKKTHFYMYSFIFSALLNLGLNLLFIPKYGYLAAAATTVVSYAFLLGLTVIFSRRFFIWKFSFLSFGKVAFSSAIMGGSLYFAINHLRSSSLSKLILLVPCGIIIYFLMLFLLKEVKIKEMQTIFKKGGEAL